MGVLELAQTIYYFAASLAIIILGVLCAVVSYHLIRITKHLRHISDNLDDASDEFKERIENIIERLSSLPILSYFLKIDEARAPRESGKKGRKPK